jgi:hypothetical protein
MSYFACSDLAALAASYHQFSGAPTPPEYFGGLSG